MTEHVDNVGLPEVTLREFDTILAALRLWQSEIEDGEYPIDFLDIAADHDKPLTASEIDVLVGTDSFLPRPTMSLLNGIS